eukprot:5972819-Amphidinium_carterae.1
MPQLGRYVHLPQFRRCELTRIQIKSNDGFTVSDGRVAQQVEIVSGILTPATNLRSGGAKQLRQLCSMRKSLQSPGMFQFIGTPILRTCLFEQHLPQTTLYCIASTPVHYNASQGILGLLYPEQACSQVVVSQICHLARRHGSAEAPKDQLLCYAWPMLHTHEPRGKSIRHVTWRSQKDARLLQDVLKGMRYDGVLQRDHTCHFRKRHVSLGQFYRQHIHLLSSASTVPKVR